MKWEYQQYTRLVVHLSVAILIVCGAWDSPRVHEAQAGSDAGEATASETPVANGSALPTTLTEARGRARILHETIHGALQVMHRDFFREDESFAIPSHSLEDVFKELDRSHGVQVRWLVVNAKAMSLDNEPQSEFERNAAKALASGEESFEAVDGQAYRYAGSVRLSSECLKCHLPSRTSNKDRAAGLVIRMPLKKQ